MNEPVADRIARTGVTGPLALAAGVLLQGIDDARWGGNKAARFLAGDARFYLATLCPPGADLDVLQRRLVKRGQPLPSRRRRVRGSA